MTKRKDPSKKFPVGKHPGGRPTKYYPELCDDLIKFFSRPLYIKKTIRKFVDGEEQIIEQEVPNETPWLIDWIMKHKISHDTPANWAKQYPEFLGAYIRSKQLQERFLAELGIKGDHSGFMTFQTLKNVAGWRDKTEVESKHEVKSVQEVIVKFEDMSKEQLTDFLLRRNNGLASKLN